MGNYLAVADVRLRFANEDELMHLTDADDSIGIGDDTVLNEVIDRVEGDMDSRLGVRYKVPVAVSGSSIENAPILKSVGLDLVRWHLQARHQRVSDATQVTYDAAIVWLDGIAEGRLVLPANLTAASTNNREPLGTIGSEDDGATTSNRFFTRERMKAV